MYRFFEQLSSRIAAPFMGERSRNSKVWHCRCGQSLFFRNSQCLACSAALGYQPQQSRLSSLQPGPQADTWLLDADPGAGVFRCCANLDSPAACNWLLPANDHDGLCIACSLNRTIPDLSIPENHERWRKVETAKRRLVAQLFSLGLQVIPKTVDEEVGLAFDFIGIDLEGKPPTTGHANGLITLDIKEADDAHREQVRVQMHEPYRTLLGHFRHEAGHYSGTAWSPTVIGWKRFAVCSATSVKATPKPLSGIISKACRSTGSNITSAPTPPCTPGKTGQKPGLTTCT